MVKNKKSMSVKGQSSRVRRQVVDILNARRELKLMESNSETTLPADGGFVALSQAIVQGDTHATRDGAQINLKEIQVRLELALNSAVSIDFARLIIFYDTSATGTYPTVANILSAADPNAGYTTDIKVSKRFRIVYDKAFPLTNAGNNKALQIVRNFKFKDLVINYLGTTNVEGSNGKNALYALLIGDQTANQTAYNLAVSMYYYDS